MKTFLFITSMSFAVFTCHSLHAQKYIELKSAPKKNTARSADEHIIEKSVTRPNYSTITTAEPSNNAEAIEYSKTQPSSSTIYDIQTSEGGKTTTTVLEEQTSNAAVGSSKETLSLPTTDASNQSGSTFYDSDEYILTNLNQTIRDNPSDADAYYKRGVIHKKMNQLASALDDYTKSLELLPDPFAYYNRGNVYFTLGKYQEAIDDYTQAILLKSDYAQAYNNRGYAKHLLGNHAAGIKDFDQAVAIDPTYQLAMKNRSDVRKAMKK